MDPQSSLDGDIAAMKKYGLDDYKPPSIKGDAKITRGGLVGGDLVKAPVSFIRKDAQGTSAISRINAHEADASGGISGISVPQRKKNISNKNEIADARSRPASSKWSGVVRGISGVSLASGSKKDAGHYALKMNKYCNGLNLDEVIEEPVFDAQMTRGFLPDNDADDGKDVNEDQGRDDT